MATQIEIYRTIEEQLSSYLEGIVDQMFRESREAMETHEIHVLRGQAIASKRLLSKLRTTLGYDHNSLG